MTNKPTLEEVKEHFKDAEMISSADLPIHKNQKFDISDRSIFDDRQIHFYSDAYWLCKKEIDNIMLWSLEHGYAKILTYKTPKFEITKEQIIELSNHTFLAERWFPEVFKKELVVGKWYFVERTRFCDPKKALILYDEKDSLCCFDHSGKYTNYYGNPKNDGYIITEATPQEVETALINEAKKRGYVLGCTWMKGYFTASEGDSFNFDIESNSLYLQGATVFRNGIWEVVGIIETITIQEAEKLLNKKIVGQ